jgi:hypothetical protein
VKDSAGAYLTTRSHSHSQLTLDRFFVPASEIATTDWALMEARLDWAQYDSKFRNFPRGKTLRTYLSDMIEKHPGITTKELIRRVGVPKTTVYDHVKYLIEDKRSIKKLKGGLYVIGSPPHVLVDWCYHNITVLFLVQHQVGVLNELCQFLNASDLFRNRERVARVWPPKREWRPIQKSRSIKVACTKDPLTYKEMKNLRSLIWKFFKQKKRLRFTLERNLDMDDDSSRKISIRNTTISKEGKFIRQYTKRMHGKRVLRTEVSSEGEFDDVVHGLEEHLEKVELWEKIRSKDRIIEELKKKNYRVSLNMEQLERENRHLREELLELKKYYIE